MVYVGQTSKLNGYMKSRPFSKCSTVLLLDKIKGKAATYQSKVSNGATSVIANQNVFGFDVTMSDRRFALKEISLKN